MMNMEKKDFKVEVEWVEETFSLKCLVEEWAEGHKDQRKENQFSMLLNALLKKSIMVRAQKFQ